MSAAASPPPPRYDSASDLARFVTEANRVDSTHIRVVLTHVADDTGVFQALLDPEVLEKVVRLDTKSEAWTVDGLACQIFGTSFHALTFSLRPNPERPFPTRSVLTPVSSGELTSGGGIALLEGAEWGIYDTARRPTSVFDGTITKEFLVQLPEPRGNGDGEAAQLCFRDTVTEITGLAVEQGRPISFIHAPVAAPVEAHIPRGVTGPGVRLGVAFRRFDDSGHLAFGTSLVDLCSRLQCGLWQRATSAGGRTHDYWDPVVLLRNAASNGYVGDRASAGTQVLAMTCVGPARVGTTDAVLQILTRAKAPLLGLSALALDDISITHLLTHAPGPGSVAVSDEERADEALSRVLGLPAPVHDDRLRDYRLVVSRRRVEPPNPALAAIWLAWQAPASSDALRLTAATLRTALDTTWSRLENDSTVKARSGHLGIDYLACRNTTSVDRLQGRMRVAVDLDALTRASTARDRALAEPDETDTGSQLGHFCSDVSRQWRAALALALGTPYLEVEVFWRESWLGLSAGTATESDDDM